jgi:hypothetical protein
MPEWSNGPGLGSKKETSFIAQASLSNQVAYAYRGSNPLLPIKKNFNENMEDRNERLWEITRSGQSLIKQGLGIRLNFFELAGLKNYISCISAGVQLDRIRDSLGDALALFVIDYFGIDVLELGGDIVIPCEKRTPGGERYWRYVSHGLHFISLAYWHGDERLKEYCRRNVEVWRDERNYL